MDSPALTQQHDDFHKHTDGISPSSSTASCSSTTTVCATTPATVSIAPIMQPTVSIAPIMQPTVSISSSSSRDSPVPDLTRSESEDGGSSISTLSSCSGTHSPGETPLGAYTPSKLGGQVVGTDKALPGAPSSEPLVSVAACPVIATPQVHNLAKAATCVGADDDDGAPSSSDTAAPRPTLGPRTASSYTNTTVQPSPTPTSTGSPATASTPAATHTTDPITTGLPVPGPSARSPTVAEQLEKEVESPIKSSSGCSWSTDAASVASGSRPSPGRHLPVPPCPPPKHRRSQPAPVQTQPQQHTVNPPLSDEVRAKAIASPDSWRSLLPEHDPFYASEAVLNSRYEAQLREEASRPDMARGASNETADSYHGTCQSAYVSSPRRMSTSSMASIQSTMSLPSSLYMYPPALANRGRHESGDSWRSLLPDNDPSVLRERYERQKAERERVRLRVAQEEAAREAETERLLQKAEAEAEAARAAAVQYRHSAGVTSTRGRANEQVRRAACGKHVSCPPTSPLAQEHSIPPPVPPKSPSPAQTQDTRHPWPTMPTVEDLPEEGPHPVSEQWLDEQRRRVKEQRQQKNAARTIEIRVLTETMQSTHITMDEGGSYFPPTEAPEGTNYVKLGKDVVVRVSPGEYTIRATMPRFRFMPESINLSCSTTRILKMIVNGAYSEFERSVPFYEDSDADLQRMRAFCDGSDLVVLVPRKANGVGGIDEAEAAAIIATTPKTSDDAPWEHLEDVQISKQNETAA